MVHSHSGSDQIPIGFFFFSSQYLLLRLHADKGFDLSGFTGISFRRSLYIYFCL